MAEAVYLMCGLTSLFCAVLLIRSFRRQRSRLLLWSSLCFVGLALNNGLLVVDFMVVPEVDLSAVRASVAAAALLLLLIGLIWESR
jgi:heme A synthase